MAGILGKPKRHLTLKQIDEAIAEAAIERAMRKVIGLDTNILLRFVVLDDPEQFARAERFVLKNCTAVSPGYVNRIVLCELVWTLERSYRYEPDKIATAISALLVANEFVFEDREAAQAVLPRYAATRGVGFVDLLVGELNRAAGCSTTATFDKKAGKRDGFTPVR